MVFFGQLHGHHLDQEIPQSIGIGIIILTIKELGIQIAIIC